MNAENLRTINQIATEVGVPFWRIKHALARAGGRIQPDIVLGNIRYFGPEGQSALKAELAEIKAKAEVYAARRKSDAVPA